MDLYSRKELLAAAALALAALAIGLPLGIPGWALFAVATVGLVYQHRDLRKFVRWAKNPLRRPKFANEGLQQASRSLRRSLKQARRRTREALRQTSHFRGLTAALPDAAILVDPQGNIVNFNNASVLLLHLNREDTGNHLGTLLRHPEAIRLLEQQTPDATAEFSSPFVEGQRLELRRVPVAKDQDLILARDVTHLNRLLSMRQDFVANVSHELRTPLTIIVGYLEVIEDEELDDATLRQLVRKLASPTHRMQTLVDDLLVLTRLESSPTPEPSDLAAVDVKQLVDGVVEDLAGLAGKRHRINQRMSCDLRLLGIEKELHSACSNLIANAIKYSPQGGNVNVSWTDCGDNGAVLEVCDDGVGIAPEHLSRLTERFYRVDRAGGRVRGGTGLGLAIVKHVLMRHNSQLQIESEVGKGSRFYCHFRPGQLQAQHSG
ncbi:MAG: phosphate regulon sensor histidine kinase PhoR [Gammaproteobacteria bacterium]|nr:phosphate regulon sensor histidine kinase PhoR [Gammaproteobacteria bacterium]